MWLTLFVGLAALGAIAGFFWFLKRLSRAKNNMTPSDVANAIDSHLEGREKPWDWDTFTSVPIANKRLDAVRLRCIELDSPLPIPKNKREELERIVQHLRSEGI